MNADKQDDRQQLVLSFREGESLRVAAATIEVVRIEADKVFLGLEAPRPVSIHRGETYLALKRAREEERASE